jgi:hypothetical protein
MVSAFSLFFLTVDPNDLALSLIYSNGSPKHYRCPTKQGI